MSEAHAILGVDAAAGPEEIRMAYRRLAYRNHPDRWHEAPPGIQRLIQRKMAELNKAYEQIGPDAVHMTEHRRQVVVDPREREEAIRRDRYARWDRAEQAARARAEKQRLAAISQQPVTTPETEQLAEHIAKAPKKKLSSDKAKRRTTERTVKF